LAGSPYPSSETPAMIGNLNSAQGVKEWKEM
jgi:hypothetical protein